MTNEHVCGLQGFGALGDVCDACHKGYMAYESTAKMITRPGSFERVRYPGFYVDGRYYGQRLGQALARARFLAVEHKRTVDVFQRDGDGNESRFRSVLPYTGVVLGAVAA